MKNHLSKNKRLGYIIIIYLLKNEKYGNKSQEYLIFTLKIGFLFVNTHHI